MKKLTLALFAFLAFTLSTSATVTVNKVELKASFKHHKKPHHHYHHYHLGNYYRSIPRGAARVVLNGQIYFRYNGTYFQERRRGFLVVPKPRVYYRYDYGQRYHNPRGNNYYKGYDYHRGHRHYRGNGHNHGGNYCRGQSHHRGNGYNSGYRNGQRNQNDKEHRNPQHRKPNNGHHQKPKQGNKNRNGNGNRNPGRDQGGRGR